ncbi:MAG: efflux RND transporter permease subunit [Pseudomonadota bacterium]
MSKPTDFFIKRPVFSTALSLLLFVIGLIAYDQLELRQYPRMEANVISVSTTYQGADADTVESFVTTKIEDAIAGVDDIDYITSSSTAGKSRVTIYLVLNADVNTALEDVSSDLASITKSLPDGVDDPVVTKMDPNASPGIVVGFSSDRKSAPEITDYLNRVIAPQIVTVSGVGAVDILGDRTYAMRLWLDPLKMAKLGVTATDVQDALNDNNIQAQPGSVRRDEQLLTINAQTDLHTAAEFNQLVVKHSGSQLVRIQDIGRAELGAESYNKSLYIGGKIGVGLAITIKSNANPLVVSVDVKKVLANLEKQMPPDMTMQYAQDSSKYIALSIHEVIRTIIESAIFVFIVIFLFIGSFRAVLIPMVTVPLSLVTTFAFMFAMGYSVNTLTLLAFVFAIGMVVDDAIVVLENIHRHIEEGLSAFEASITGAREIVFVVIAMTFTLVAVYAPIGFTTGLTSILFKEFAFTLAAAVVISGFTALTLSPMMCAKLMKPLQKESRIEEKINRIIFLMTEKYKIYLTRTLNNKSIIIVLMVGIIALGAIFFPPLQATSTLAPAEDQGILSGKANAPTGASIDYTKKYTTPLNAEFKKIPEIERQVIINGQGGENNASFYLGLTDWSARDRSASDIQKELMKITDKIPGMRFSFFSPSSLPGSSGVASTQLVLKSTGSFEELNTISEKLLTQLEALPGVLSVDSDLKLNSPQITVSIDRSRASSLGISMSDINAVLKLALSESTVGSFVKDGQGYDVIPQLDTMFRNDPEKLNHLYVKTEGGQMIPLANIITVTNTISPDTLSHFQQQRSVTMTLILAAGTGQQQVITAFETLLKSDQLPEYVSYDFSGDTRQFIESGSSMFTIFLFSLIFIYLVLSAQFESFIDPFVVMFTVPLALVGALVTLYSVGASLNIYTEIGLITLVGLISKHGILMVAFANQLCETGLSIHEAIQASAAIRLRPILMTTAAVILGALPLILANGAGSVARSQMGWTIAGGMLFGTILTLFVIPTMYTLFKKNLHFQDK